MSSGRVTGRPLGDWRKASEKIRSCGPTAVTYEIEKQKDANGRMVQTIKCLKCNKISWNLNDVAHKFCGHCDEFHETLIVPRRRRA